MYYTMVGHIQAFLTMTMFYQYYKKQEESLCPSDLLLSDDDFDNQLRLNNEELADLIYETAKFRKVHCN